MNKKLDYFRENDDLIILYNNLKGKPDRPGWRDHFNKQNSFVPELDSTPIKFKGRIIPTWAVNDYHAIIARDPELKDILLNNGEIEVPDLESIL